MVRVVSDQMLAGQAGDSAVGPSQRVELVIADYERTGYGQLCAAENILVADFS